MRPQKHPANWQHFPFPEKTSNSWPWYLPTVRKQLEKFDFSVIGDDDYVPQIADLIDKTLENFSVNVTDAHVCIDRRLALKKNFAIDKGLIE